MLHSVASPLLSRGVAQRVPFTAAKPLRSHRVVARSEPSGSNTTEKAGSTSPQQEELPPWVRREKEREMQAAEAAKGRVRLPWPLALLGSALAAIAATGAIFEYSDHHAVFGVLQPDSPLWAPVLLAFILAGYPLSGVLFKFGVDTFNEEAEKQDKLDGYTK